MASAGQIASQSLQAMHLHTDTSFAAAAQQRIARGGDNRKRAGEQVRVLRLKGR